MTRIKTRPIDVVIEGYVIAGYRFRVIQPDSREERFVLRTMSPVSTLWRTIPNAFAAFDRIEEVHFALITFLAENCREVLK